MEANVLPTSNLCHLFNGIYRPMSILAAGTDNRDRVGINQRRQVSQIHFLTVIGTCLLDEDIEVEPRLEECSVRSLAHNNVGFCDTFGCQSPVTVGLHSHKDALRSSGGEGSAAFLVSVVHVHHHPDDLGVHLSKGWMNGRMQRICESPLCIDVSNKIIMSLLSMVYSSGDLACLPMLRVQLLAFGNQVQDVLLRHALLRQVTAGGCELFRKLPACASCYLLHLRLYLLLYRRQSLEQRNGQAHEVPPQAFPGHYASHPAQDSESHTQDHHQPRHLIGLPALQ
mmetsp:Transcript_148133/g.283872  ORF Transcript_148133/g.283872 Transcript_148133/m.283872 type:complete len:283 (+) Transcript_148133:776-1624(+)